jgi:hypothetical protein
MSEYSVTNNQKSTVNKDLDSCFMESDFAQPVSDSNANEVDTLDHDVPNEADEEVKGGEITEISKAYDDSETNDDIGSSSSNSFTLNNPHSNCDHFSETSSQDLPDSGTEMESDTRALVKDYTVPKLSAEDELLMEINKQLPESEDVSKIQHPNGISCFSHPAYKTVIQEMAQFKEQISMLSSEVSR